MVVRDGGRGDGREKEEKGKGGRGGRERGEEKKEGDKGGCSPCHQTSEAASLQGSHMPPECCGTWVFLTCP